MAVLSAALVLLNMTACGSGKASTEESKNASQSEEIYTSDPGNYLDVSGVDFSKPSIIISYKDYDGMEKLSKKMQNYELEQDTFVEIDGETYDAETFSVLVPDGWVAVPNGSQLDLYKAASANDTFGANEITLKYAATGRGTAIFRQTFG